MKFFILSGSHREKSQSRKVSDFVKTRIEKLFPEVEIHLYSLENNPLPLWDEGVWNKDEKWQKLWGPVKKELESSDAVIIVTPEWAGMPAPGVKNFMVLASGGCMSHKAGLLMAVSSSRGGAYPIAEMRATSTKNNQLCLIPEHIIVRDSEKHLLGESPSSDDDKYLRGRIDYSLKLLKEYAKALKTVRESGVVDGKTYGNGM